MAYYVSIRALSPTYSPLLYVGINHKGMSVVKFYCFLLNFQQVNEPSNDFIFSGKRNVKRTIVIVADLQADANFGLGITVSDVEGDGIIVKSLMRNGPAERDGRLHIGDRINNIAGHSLEGATEADADWLIHQLHGCIRVVASRPVSWKSDPELCPGRLSEYSRDSDLNTELNSDRRESSGNRVSKHTSLDRSDLDLDTTLSPELHDLPMSNTALIASQQITAECHNIHTQAAG